MTSRSHRTNLATVYAYKPDRPYFDAWLRRTKRQFAVSGRLTQTATLLAADGDGSTEEWATRLRTMMNGQEVPSIELLTRIDALIAGPSKPISQSDSQALLF